jgi:hypothetical protein
MQNVKLATLCYLRQGGKTLMLYLDSVFHGTQLAAQKMLEAGRGGSEAPALPSATNSVDTAPGGAAGMSFCLSFHLALLGPTGAHWLDNAPNVSCK